MARYEEWLSRARSSLNLSKIAVITMGNIEVQYEDLCFQAQQAAEKAIKGLLIYFKVEPEFTHNIEKLLEELAKFTAIPANIRATEELTVYASQTRYPGEYDEITKEEYEKAVEIAEECIEWVENKIKDIEKSKSQT